LGNLGNEAAPSRIFFSGRLSAGKSLSYSVIRTSESGQPRQCRKGEGRLDRYPIRHRKCARTRSVGQAPALHGFAGFVRALLGSATRLLPRAMGDANELSANGNVQVVAAGRHRIVGGERSRMGPDHAEPGDPAGDAAAGSRRRRRRDRCGFRKF